MGAVRCRIMTPGSSGGDGKLNRINIISFRDGLSAFTTTAMKMRATKPRYELPMVSSMQLQELKRGSIDICPKSEDKPALAQSVVLLDEST